MVFGTVTLESIETDVVVEVVVNVMDVESTVDRLVELEVIVVITVVPTVVDADLVTVLVAAVTVLVAVVPEAERRQEHALDNVAGGAVEGKTNGVLFALFPGVTVICPCIAVVVVRGVT